MTKTVLDERTIAQISRKLKPFQTAFANRYPGESGQRQPVHTVYGGAHLFKSNTAARLGELAAQSLETYAANTEIFGEIFGLGENSEAIYERVKLKLKTEAVEDFRVDFEDGYGTRPEEEEDEHALAAAVETAKALEGDGLPPFFGIRVKSFSEETFQRSVRTLDLYLTNLIEKSSGSLPENFVVTLPKVNFPAQMTALADIFDRLEDKLKLPAEVLKMEMMVETTQSLVDENGAANLPRLLAAGRGRCSAAHFGAYDYTASCGITAAHQNILHPACDFARHQMQIALSGTGVCLSDGATNILPIPPHRGDLNEQQVAENQTVVRRAWHLHYQNVRHSLANGFYQGWDLHPAQIPARYAAVYGFFLENLAPATERLNNFLAKAAQATLVGDVFDDAATGQGLLNYFVRAVNCRALSEQEAQQLTGLSLQELRGGSFAEILRNRKQ